MLNQSSGLSHQKFWVKIDRKVVLPQPAFFLNPFMLVPLNFFFSLFSWTRTTKLSPWRPTKLSPSPKYPPVSQDILRQYSGRTHIKKIIKWLSDRNLPFDTDADGKPVIAQDVFFKNLGIQVEQKPAETQPNWDSI